MMPEKLMNLWPYLTIVAIVGTATIASAHAILHKRNPRAAFGWVALIWLSPFVGTLLYCIFGVNRIDRRLTSMQASTTETEAFATPVPAVVKKRTNLVNYVNHIVPNPIAGGNQITPLQNGEVAYAKMLAAIDTATQSICLMTYIFDNDAAGQRFFAALSRAKARGVAIRVLVDDVGARYSWPSIDSLLRRQGIATARFLPTRLPWRLAYMNLRNHRKIMVVDGKIGFVGGMNIRQGHMIKEGPKHAIEDLHFRVEGPVVEQIQRVFAKDWAFTTNERLTTERWFQEIATVGEAWARGIADGPDADFETIRWTICGAITSARRSIHIVTPYFLPDFGLMTLLTVAAMSRVHVEIILPKVNNLKLVQWAATANLNSLIEHGCKVYLSSPPFDHTKIFIVDDYWSFIGSSNWDARSLRLNFEFNLECYDTELAAKLRTIVDDKRKRSTRVTSETLSSRHFLVKLRDASAKLFSPYL